MAALPSGYTATLKMVLIYTRLQENSRYNGYRNGCGMRLRHDRMLANKRDTMPPKKHGNIPL